MINSHSRSAVLCAVLCLSLWAEPRSAAAGANPFLGEIETFAFNFCPAGWAALNGQLLPINQNQALFALLGTTLAEMGRLPLRFLQPNRFSLRPALPYSSASPCKASSRHEVDRLTYQPQQSPLTSRRRCALVQVLEESAEPAVWTPLPAALEAGSRTVA